MRVPPLWRMEGQEETSTGDGVVALSPDEHRADALEAKQNIFRKEGPIGCLHYFGLFAF